MFKSICGVAERHWHMSRPAVPVRYGRIDSGFYCETDVTRAHYTDPPAFGSGETIEEAVASWRRNCLELTTQTDEERARGRNDRDQASRSLPVDQESSD